MTTKQDRNMQQNTGSQQNTGNIQQDRQDRLGKQERRQGNVTERETYRDRQDSNIDQGLDDKMDRQDNLGDQRGNVQGGNVQDKGFSSKK